MSVQSGSMSPTFDAGDMIVTKTVDRSQVSTGDVITYQKENILVSHRVIELVHQNGNVLYQTKGDANNVEDETLVTPEQLSGKMLFHIPKAGYIVHFIQTPAGIAITIGTLILFLVGHRLWKLMMPVRTNKKNASA